MPRSKPHFKSRTTIKNHAKMAEVYQSNDLLAFWLRLGIEAIERFADRTGDTFLVSDRELMALSGKGRPDVARTWLRRLADVGPISAEREGDVWRITFPNFSKKQGFTRKNGRETEVSASATPTATASPEEKESAPAPRAASCGPPAGKASRGKRPRGPTAFPADTTDLEAGVRAWLAKHPEHGDVDVGFALDKCRDWARSNGKRKADWLATVRGGIRDGWLLRPSAQGARASPAQDRSERGRAEARRILQRKRQAT